jgi:hypothetical protein
MPGREAVPVPDVYATISEADAATQERLAATDRRDHLGEGARAVRFD